MMKAVLVGAGARGTLYADYMQEKGLFTIEAVVEPRDERRTDAADRYGVAEDRRFAEVEGLWALGKIADVAIIASMDRDHYAQVMRALDLGYHLLLEKPISPDPRECLDIQKKADEKGLQVVVCHVMRYTPFLTALKRIVDSGELGKVITIQHNENIGNFHMAHSFVRGNWRNSDLSSPIIMQKSCHDMDMLAWLTGSASKSIASYGSLSYFKAESAPPGSGTRCCDCAVEPTCRYSAYKAYLPVLGSWPATVVSLDQSEEAMREALLTSPYGRCVYHCDNNVCDHQVTIIEFENGITATFNLSAFTNQVTRTVKVMCEKGEIRGHSGKNELEVTHYASNAVDAFEQTVTFTGNPTSGHGGGDAGLVDDFYALLQSGGKGDSRSSIGRSVESHMMAYAAERSRLEHQVVDMAALYGEFGGAVR